MRILGFVMVFLLSTLINARKQNFCIYNYLIKKFYNLELTACSILHTVLNSVVPIGLKPAVPVHDASPDGFRIVFLKEMTAVTDELRLDITKVHRCPLG